MEVLWSGHPPRSAAANVRSYVAHVRRLLADPLDALNPPDPTESADPAVARATIDSVGARYVLRIDPGSLDALLFRDLVVDGRTHLQHGRPALAVERLTRALALWRGPVLDSLPLPMAVEADADFLTSMRIDALEDSIEARLELGEHSDLVGELRVLVDRHAYRERLWGQLLLALYRSGRQVEAIDAYADLRQRLDRELGVAPTAVLRQLHQQILRSDARLDRAAVAMISATAAEPRQLPTAVRPFVGRRPELERLTASTLRRDRPPAVVVVGGPQVGTSALAIHWAHSHAEDFPDGQVYLDAAGAGGRLPPERLVARALAAMGHEVTPDAAIADLEAAYRSAIARQRLLILLDNAAGPEQVHALLPGTPASLLLVATSQPMPDLVARVGALRLHLDPLSTEEASELLAFASTSLGRPLIPHDSEALRAITLLCEGLPLAVRRVAEILARTPNRPVASVLEDVIANPGLVRDAPSSPPRRSRFVARPAAGPPLGPPRSPLAHVRRRPA